MVKKSLKKYHQLYQRISYPIYEISLAFMVIGLLFSRGMLSTGLIAFSLNWIIEGNYREKLNLLKKNKAYLVICLIIGIHVIGLIHTENLIDGLLDLKIKLPLLLPIFFFSNKKLLDSKRHILFIYLFVFATLISSLVAFFRFEVFHINFSIEDLNLISLVGQNIRLSLFVNFSIFSSLYILFTHPLKTYQKLLLAILILWLSTFLYLINSLTGHITFIALLLTSLIFISKKRVLLISLAIFILLFGWVSTYIYQINRDFNKTEQIKIKDLPLYTTNGNTYIHDLKSKISENGYLTYINICKTELHNEWAKNSEFSLSGEDLKGQPIFYTLIRYMTSKGLKKDSLDFQKLTKEDIRFIENGCANYLYKNKYSLKARIYNILWQLRTYEQTGDATAQSISQRIDFLKVSKGLIAENFWFGVGSGDVMADFYIYMEKNNYKLEPSYRNRVHNQFIVEFVSLGVFGFIAFMIITFHPILHFKVWKSYLNLIFFIIIILSYFTDNTLETQLGTCFFSLFYCILLAKD